MRGSGVGGPEGGHGAGQRGSGAGGSAVAAGAVRGVRTPGLLFLLRAPAKAGPIARRMPLALRPAAWAPDICWRKFRGDGLGEVRACFFCRTPADAGVHRSERRACSRLWVPAFAETRDEGAWDISEGFSLRSGRLAAAPYGARPRRCFRACESYRERKRERGAQTGFPAVVYGHRAPFVRGAGVISSCFVFSRKPACTTVS